MNRHAWSFLALGLGALVCLWCGPAWGRAGDLLVKLTVPAEFAPSKVCLHVETLSPELTQLREAIIETSVIGTPPVLPDGVTIPVEGTACSAKPTNCDTCKPAPGRSAEVCVEDVNAQPGRTVHLLLEHAGLREMKLEGPNLRLAVDYPETRAVTPRVEVLGGHFHAGEVESVTSGQDVRLTLKPRCIERRLRLPPGAQDSCKVETLTSNGHKTFTGSPPAWPRAVNDSALTVHVSESGLHNEVELDHCGTIFAGSFTYPPPPELVLAARVFPVVWKPHCLVRAAGTVHGCPKATLSSHGHECKPITCTSEGDCAPECRDACCYKCEPAVPVEFPTPVRFSMTVEGSGEGAIDPLVWEESMRFPGDRLSAFVASDRRRVFLDWENVDNERRNWGDHGNEVDSLEIVGPDGRAHRVKRGTTSLAAPGLECHDRFAYQYLGRWPDQPRQQPLEGDTIRLEATTERQRVMILGVRGHAGALYYADVHNRGVASPYFDVTLAGLIYEWPELAITGAFSLHPRVRQGPDQDAERDMLPLARLALTLGHRLYVNDRWVLGGRYGGGVAFPALAADWSKAHQFPIGVVSVMLGYEVTRSTTLEAGFRVLGPEQYLESSHDSAGPTGVRSVLTVASAFVAGVQWADL